MIKAGIIAVVLALAFHKALIAEDSNAGRAPVLLELFTSEGCSSCPPADRLLAELDSKQPVPGAEMIVLSEHVDYWDRLGWKDPFSSPQNTARQNEYANRLHLDSIYTPQLVVDGRADVVGSDEGNVMATVRRLSSEPKISIAITNVVRRTNEVVVHVEFSSMMANGKEHEAALYIALADEKAETQVARGENAGHSLVHVAVMRSLTQAATLHLDSPYSGNFTIKLPAGSGNNDLRVVAFLQDRRSGHVLGAGLAKLRGPA